MDGKTFAKLSKDTKILDKKLTATDIDLIFAKSKDKAARKINFAQFQKAIGFCAEKKGVTAEALSQAIVESGGPTFSGTKADAVRLHDDKDQYTGVYAQGGPTNVDTNPGGKIYAPSEEEKKAAPKKAAPAQAATSSAPAGSLNEVFSNFTAGASDMDGKTFAKFSKDTKILDKKLTATDIDLIFAKVKDKTARKITFDQFKKAISLCAEKKGLGAEALEEKILEHGGPTFKGTKAEAVRHHDDKSLYTGVYAHGGPSTVGGTGGVHDISETCDRSAADVRGVKK